MIFFFLIFWSLKEGKKVMRKKLSRFSRILVNSRKFDAAKYSILENSRKIILTKNRCFQFTKVNSQTKKLIFCQLLQKYNYLYWNLFTLHASFIFATKWDLSKEKKLSQVAGITNAIRLGTKELAPIRSFPWYLPINIWSRGEQPTAIHCNLWIEERKTGYSRSDFDSDDDDYEFELHNRGAFHTFTDFNKE